MEVNIQAIHFDATQKLEDFIVKKLNRLVRHNEAVTNIDVTLKVIKPETSMNKEAAIKVEVPGLQDDVFASKIADTFEEAVDLTIEAIDRQLEKIKQKNQVKK